jgi:hypothetical protein
MKLVEPANSDSVEILAFINLWFAKLWFAKTLADFEISEIAARPPLFCYNS